MNSPKHLTFTCLLLLTAACSTLANPFAPALPMPSAQLTTDTLITRIAVGSCFGTYNSPAVFDRIRQQSPQAFLFLGDNVYADDESLDPELTSLKTAYAELAAMPAFEALRAEVPTLVTWDDHDFGLNDAGADFPSRETSESLFEYVWSIPAEDPRAQRPGIYHSHISGPVGQRVQFIVLDTRFFRTPVLKAGTTLPHGRYIPNTSPDQALLGEAQWQWLESQLNKEAELRIIATSIQVIADGHNWEAWRLFPRERQRLFDLLTSTSASGVVVVSGDRHGAYMYQLAGQTPYPLFELTASSLNIPLTDWVNDPQDEPGPNRLFKPYYGANYGLIDINWSDRHLTLRIVDDKNQPVHERQVLFSELK